MHTYLVGQSEGHTVLDSLRAARHLLQLPASSRSLVWGHSQGGGAALWAAELAPTYAPDTNVVGALAGAPAAELTSAAAQTTDLGFRIAALAGFEAAYPNLSLDEVATAAGKVAVDKVATQCIDDILGDYQGRNPSTYLTSTQPADWNTALTENNPGQHKTSVPIFIYHGDQDTIVPPATSAAVASAVLRAGRHRRPQGLPGHRPHERRPGRPRRHPQLRARPDRRQARPLFLLRTRQAFVVAGGAGGSVAGGATGGGGGAGGGMIGRRPYASATVAGSTTWAPTGIVSSAASRSTRQ